MRNPSPRNPLPTVLTVVPGDTRACWLIALTLTGDRADAARTVRRFHQERASERRTTMTTEEYAYHLDMGGPYRDAYNAALDARAEASTRRWTDRAAEVAAVAARRSTAAAARHKPPPSRLPPQPGELLSAAAAPSSSSSSAAVSMERITKQAEQPTPAPRPSLKESQAAHWERLLELTDGGHGPRMPPVAPFARQVRGTPGGTPPSCSAGAAGVGDECTCVYVCVCERRRLVHDSSRPPTAC